MDLIFPKDYKSALTVRETQDAISHIRDIFQKEFRTELNLQRVSAPLFVRRSTGLNDDLSGVERKVSFTIGVIPGEEMEIVQSLAKWKRVALRDYGFQMGEGLYTDMLAIRRDDDCDNLHSIFVDQWDWERIISLEDRTEEFLQDIVRRIFKAMKSTAVQLNEIYPGKINMLPDEIHFVDSEELRQRYPGLTPKQRENAACKEFGAIFLMRIGDKLGDGEPHDGRAPDYDDWSLNGDILFWYEPLQMAMELSSMGIRVTETSMHEQLIKKNMLEREALPYHQAILKKELPYTIGGGVGESRLVMLLLNKAHIGEVHASEWPEGMKQACAEHGIYLL